MFGWLGGHDGELRQTIKLYVAERYNATASRWAVLTESTSRGTTYPDAPLNQRTTASVSMLQPIVGRIDCMRTDWPVAMPYARQDGLAS